MEAARARSGWSNCELYLRFGMFCFVITRPLPAGQQFAVLDT